jgi:hypothetical protein
MAIVHLSKGLNLDGIITQPKYRSWQLSSKKPRLIGALIRDVVPPTAMPIEHQARLVFYAKLARDQEGSPQYQQLTLMNRKRRNALATQLFADELALNLSRNFAKRINGMGDKKAVSRPDRRSFIHKAS